MSAFERLQDKTFTPEKMTPIDWVIWNSRAQLPRELLEQAADQLEHLTKRAIGETVAPPIERDWSGEEEDKAWAHLQKPPRN